MSIEPPVSFPLKLLVIPSLIGFLAWGVVAKAHGGLALPPPFMAVSVGAVLVAILLELVVVPLGVRRLLVAPPPRTLGNLLAVVLAGTFLLLQLVLTLVGLL
jgi:hypothetical protein